MLIGIPREPYEDQPLVAATPDTVTKIVKLGYEVVVESGAGALANYPNQLYSEAGARVVAGNAAWEADIVVCLDTPPLAQRACLRSGAVLITRAAPAQNPELLNELAQADITLLAMDAVPRISRAQALDVRSSMANIGGYRAVIEAANEFDRLFGGQVTAAGKIPPARVYVIGVGVAGLAALGAAGSMGAEVFATDVRAEVADQVESLGATFVEIPVKQESSDGYAREMNESEQDQVLAVYEREAALSDIVITTAQIPGRPSPLLLTEAAIAAMKPGSIVVDMGASEEGSNCALTVPGEVVRTENGVTIIGYTDLPRRMPAQASQLFGQNIVNFLKLTTPDKDGVLTLDESDEIVRGVTAVLDGEIMWPPPPVSVSAQTAPVASKPVSSSDSEPKKPAKKVKGWMIALAVVLLPILLAAPPQMIDHLWFFVLSVVIGFYVITNVTHKLHTPLMSVTNAISGIIILGAMVTIGSSNPVVVGISFVAMVIASINIFGGFLVTHRMLKMFERSSEE